MAGLETGRVVEDDDHAGDAQPGVVELLVGLHRLGGRVIGAVGVEPVGDRAAGGAGKEEEGDRDQADPARTAVGEACERVEHQAALPGGRLQQPRFHPVAPIGKPLAELDPALEHHQRQRVALLDRLRFHRPQLLGDLEAPLAHRPQDLDRLLGREQPGEEQLQQSFFAHL